MKARKKSKTGNAFKSPRRPSAQKLKGRKTTITNAFVLSILPVVNSTEDEFHEALRVLGQSEDDRQCVYCGAPSHGWDHLRPIVQKMQPTGFITEVANLVPACGRCNSSKGGADWRTWMLSTKASGSPTSRGIPDVRARIKRIEKFERWRKPIKIDFAAIVGAKEWAAYWESRKKMIEEMMRCQDIADQILKTVQEHLNKNR